MDIKRIEKLCELMRKQGLQELNLREGDTEVKLSFPPKDLPAAALTGGQAYLAGLTGLQGGLSAQMTGPSHQVATGAPQAGQESSTPSTPADKTNATAGQRSSKARVIKSPFVGTFYHAPSPGADPFVQVGQRIKKGDTLCIVEAMKLMNEIEAEWGGVVTDVLVENEQPVEFDQELFIVE